MATFSQLPRDLICLVAQQDYELVRVFLVLNKKCHRSVVNTSLCGYAEEMYLRRLRSEIIADIREILMSNIVLFLDSHIELSTEFSYEADNDFVNFYETVDNSYNRIKIKQIIDTITVNLRQLLIYDYQWDMEMWSKIGRYCNLPHDHHNMSYRDSNMHQLIIRFQELSEKKN